MKDIIIYYISGIFLCGHSGVYHFLEMGNDAGFSNLQITTIINYNQLYID